MPQGNVLKTQEEINTQMKQFCFVISPQCATEQLCITSAFQQKCKKIKWISMTPNIATDMKAQC